MTAENPKPDVTRSADSGRTAFKELSAKSKTVLALLAILLPIGFLGLVELGLRLSGADTELVPNDNIEIAIPAWLIADDNFAQGLQPGVKAANVAWLREFTEARYIWTKMKPNIQFDALNPYNDIELAKGVTWHFSSNSQGFRGREFGPKPPGVLRVVCIGDSSTFGWGVDDEYTYPRLLEARLNRDTRKTFEVFNLGIPGFTSRHGLGVLQHYTQGLDADFFVFSFGANDPRLVLRPTDESLADDEGWRGTVRFGLLQFKTYQLIRKLSFEIHDPSEQFKDARPKLVPSVSNEQYTANLNAMIGIARERGARPVLMSVCSPVPIANRMHDVAVANDVPMVNSFDLLFSRLDDLKAHRLYPDEIRHYEAIYGADVMDERWQLYITTDGCHPNRAGMSIIADALANVIEYGAQGD